MTFKIGDTVRRTADIDPTDPRAKNPRYAKGFTFKIVEILPAHPKGIDNGPAALDEDGWGHLSKNLEKVE